MSSIDDEGGDAPCWAHLFEDDEPAESESPGTETGAKTSDAGEVEDEETAR